MGLIGIIGTVRVQNAGSRLIVTIPSKAIQQLMIQKGDTLLVRIKGKDLVYRRVE